MRLRTRYGLSGRHRDDDFDQPSGGTLHEASSWNCQGATELASACGQQGYFDQLRASCLQVETTLRLSWRGWLGWSLQRILVQPHTLQQCCHPEYCVCPAPGQIECEDLPGIHPCRDAIRLTTLHEAATSKDAGGHDAEEVAAGLVSQSVADVLGSEAWLQTCSFGV